MSPILNFYHLKTRLSIVIQNIITWMNPFFFFSFCLLEMENKKKIPLFNWTNTFNSLLFMYHKNIFIFIKFIYFQVIFWPPFAYERSKIKLKKNNNFCCSLISMQSFREQVVRSFSLLLGYHIIWISMNDVGASVARIFISIFISPVIFFFSSVFFSFSYPSKMTRILCCSLFLHSCSPRDPRHCHIHFDFYNV